MKNIGDEKTLWKSINFNGIIKEDRNDDIKSQDIAEVFQRKCQLEYKETKFHDITNTMDDEQDREITEEDIETAANKLRNNTKSADDISTNIVKLILPIIMSVLLILFNSVFKGGINSYPIIWISLMLALPKKGKLELPNCVPLCITMLNQFAKMYDLILLERLMKVIKIPKEQTAYQKGKGCFINVARIRFLKLIVAKTKTPLFIVFTDFKAAFDLVSRRILFHKLVKIGISTVLLNASMGLYTNIQTALFHNHEFSERINLLAGIKQGDPTFRSDSDIQDISYITYNKNDSSDYAC